MAPPEWTFDNNGRKRVEKEREGREGREGGDWKRHLTKYVSGSGPGSSLFVSK